MWNGVTSFVPIAIYFQWFKTDSHDSTKTDETEYDTELLPLWMSLLIFMVHGVSNAMQSLQ